MGYGWERGIQEKGTVCGVAMCQARPGKAFRGHGVKGKGARLSQLTSSLALDRKGQVVFLFFTPLFFGGGFSTAARCRSVFRRSGHVAASQWSASGHPAPLYIYPSPGHRGATPFSFVCSASLSSSQ